MNVEHLDRDTDELLSVKIVDEVDAPFVDRGRRIWRGSTIGWSLRSSS